MNGKQFLDATRMFYKVNIRSINLNTNFVFFQWKSRELLSFLFGLASYPYMDSNYELIEARKNGSLMFWCKIWLGNIFSISWDHSSQNQILGKKYVRGQLFTALIALEMCWKVSFGHHLDHNFWTVSNS